MSIRITESCKVSSFITKKNMSKIGRLPLSYIIICLFFSLHSFYTRTHMLFLCTDFLSFFLLLNRSDSKIGWRKLATTRDVIRILIYSLALFLLHLLFFFFSFAVFFFYYHLTYTYTYEEAFACIHSYIYTEDAMKITERGSMYIFLVCYQQLNNT